MKWLPNGVKVTAERNGDLRLRYSRLVRLYTTMWNLESNIEQVIKKFEALEATADRLLAAFDDHKTDLSTLRAVSLDWDGEQTEITPDMMDDLPKNMLVIEHINLPMFQALVKEDVGVVENLLRYISRHDKSLARTLTSPFVDFQKAWEWDPGPPTNRKAREIRTWISLCTWRKGLADDGLCPMLTFIHRLQIEEYRIGAPKINFEISFVERDYSR